VERASVMTEDERHEQLLYELAQIQAHVFQVNLRTYEVAQQLQRVEHRVRRAEWTVDALWLMFLVGFATYLTSKLVEETWTVWAIIAGLLIFSSAWQARQRAAEGRSANGDRAPDLDPRVERLRH
jgi:hypothetical protein